MHRIQRIVKTKMSSSSNLVTSNWRDSEIRKLLSVRAEPEIIQQMVGTARDSLVYDQITKRLSAHGVQRTKQQINNKLKSMKRQYHQLLEHNGKSGIDPKIWPYYNSCEAIWGPDVRLVVVGMEAPSTSRSTEAQSTSSGLSTPSPLPESAPYSDTEEYGVKMEPEECGVKEEPNPSNDEPIPSHNEPIPNYDETDLLLDDPLLCDVPDSPCSSPVAKKRKKPPTRSEKVFSEMYQVLAKIDKDFEAREQRRWQRQLAYEEQRERRFQEKVERERERDQAFLKDMCLKFAQPHQMPAAEQRRVDPEPLNSLQICSCGKDKDPCAEEVPNVSVIIIKQQQEKGHSYSVSQIKVCPNVSTQTD